MKHQHAATARPEAEPTEVRGWFAGRLPDDWFEGQPEITLDTEEILLEFGYTWEEIAELRATGVIGPEPEDGVASGDTSSEVSVSRE